MMGSLTFYLILVEGLQEGLQSFLVSLPRKRGLSHLQILNSQMGFCPASQEFSININSLCINKYYNLNKDSKNGST